MKPHDPPTCQAQTDSTARILVVDDEVLLRKLIVAVLYRVGHQNIDVASNGAEAWEALHKTNYGLVITDHQMPGLTGVELIGQMRSVGMKQPVILLSGVMGGLVDRIAMRIDAILQKPVEIAEMVATINRLLHLTDEPGKQAQTLSAGKIGLRFHQSLPAKPNPEQPLIKL